jgi:hypothetical protein
MQGTAELDDDIVGPINAFRIGGLTLVTADDVARTLVSAVSTLVSRLFGPSTELRAYPRQPEPSTVPASRSAFPKLNGSRPVSYTFWIFSVEQDGDPELFTTDTP